MTFTIHGISASKGVAIGRVHALERDRSEVVERQLDPSRIEAEVERFARAVDAARLELRAVKARIPDGTPREIAAFIDTHLLMLEDEAISSAPIAYIREKRCNAEWALKLECDALVAVFDAMDDPYLRTRKNDVEHVVNRVQIHLGGTDEGNRRSRSPSENAAAGKIIYADDLTPADTVLMQHQGVAGFMTEFGGPNSHTAILARSLNIPAVVGLHRSAALLRDGDEVVIDGREGIVVVSPTKSVKRFYERRRREIERIRSARRKLRATPTVTADGEPVVLQANVELPGESAGAVRDGAAGVGLYRTEFLFMNRIDPPDEQEQYETYAELVAALKGAPVTIRTLDLGADKQVDGARPDAPVTSNPALGLRAVRLCLKEQSLFRPQIRAILRASASGPVRMLIPMLATTTELDEVLRIVRDCKRDLDARGEGYDRSMPVGAMIEVPAAAICADIFARRLDFLSIGTNDLIQYTIAIDRVDDEVSYLYDPLHPAVLRLVAATIVAGRKAGIPVAMCGEMAGDARYTKLLLGMGLREFSVHPNALLEVKQIIGETQVAPARKLARRILRSTRTSTRHALIEELNQTAP
ncbi:MAG: phosphoenolpyruvate--protein phosphotransferase [Thiotrichales bacterium]|nr:phosphoenolpyruvate--protein phosphotransferase [Thiotrichales bacterium]